MDVSNTQTFKGFRAKIGGVEMWKMALAVFAVFTPLESPAARSGDDGFFFFSEHGV